MISFDDALKVLEKAADALPDGIFDGLNGGINLLPDVKKSEDDEEMFTLGQYFCNSLGRYVNLYYGSFEALYGHLSDEKIAEKLKKTLYHELTHHVESLAGDRSLEREDEEYLASYEAFKRGEPLPIESILFVCEDNASLSPMAEGLWNVLSQQAGLSISCTSAAMAKTCPAAVCPEAVEAASAYGADIAAHAPQPVNAQMLSSHSIVFCMTEEQADDLADEYPRYDVKIYALGDQDILPPHTAADYQNAAAEMEKTFETLIKELKEEENSK